MVKILSQAGISLADIYDVVGSIAGVERLLPEDVFLIHELGGTVASERLSGNVQRATTGAILQSIVWNLTLPHPGGIYRILGVAVLADVTGRTARAQVSIRSIGTGREMPIFIWDTANDFTSNIVIAEDGGAAADQVALIQTSPQMGVPTLGIAAGQPAAVGDEIVFRGASSAFGAGNVTLVALVYLASSETDAFIAVGLPIPGW